MQLVFFNSSKAKRRWEEKTSNYPDRNRAQKHIVHTWSSHLYKFKPFVCLHRIRFMCSILDSIRIGAIQLIWRRSSSLTFRVVLEFVITFHINFIKCLSNEAWNWANTWSIANCQTSVGRQRVVRAVAKSGLSFLYFFFFQIVAHHTRTLLACAVCTLFNLPDAGALNSFCWAVCGVWSRSACTDPDDVWCMKYAWQLSMNSLSSNCHLSER